MAAVPNVSSSPKNIIARGSPPRQHGRSARAALWRPAPSTAWLGASALSAQQPNAFLSPRRTPRDTAQVGCTACSSARTFIPKSSQTRRPPNDPIAWTRLRLRCAHNGPARRVRVSLVLRRAATDQLIGSLVAPFIDQSNFLLL